MEERLSTGIPGLDDVLRGGLLAGEPFMVRGTAGTGKTTLGAQFLMAGARRGEATLYIALTEHERVLRNSAARHGWDLDGIHILDIHPGLGAGGFTPEGQYTIFHPADVELGPVTGKITEAVRRLRPTRVVFDNLSEIGSLTRDAIRYRRQVSGLKDFFSEQGCTALLLAESNHHGYDDEVLSLVHGVIQLGQARGRDGRDRRILRVEKYRDSEFAAGEHALEMDRQGLVVYPRMLATEHGRDFPRDVLGSGIAGMDRLLGGGVDRGTTTLIAGSSGAGKTTVGMSILVEAARRGERSVAYSYEEGSDEMVIRCEALGLGARPLVERGLLKVEKVNPLVLYPDQFASWIRDEVERHGTRVVMIDSLNGYVQTMPDEQYLVSHMSQLVSYLDRMGVATILTQELPTLTEMNATTQFGLSHLVDTIVLLKLFEAEGGLRIAAGAVKRRLGGHERAFRSLEFAPGSIRVGDTLPQFRGILRGEAEDRGRAAEPGPVSGWGMEDG